MVGSDETRIHDMCKSYSSPSNAFKGFGDIMTRYRWLKRVSFTMGMDVSIRLLRVCGWSVKDHFYYTHLVLHIQQVCPAMFYLLCFFLFPPLWFFYQCTLSLSAEVEDGCSTSNLSKQIVWKWRPRSLRESILHLWIFIENPSPHHAHFGTVSSISCSLALPALSLVLLVLLTTCRCFQGKLDWLLTRGLSRQINRQIHLLKVPTCLEDLGCLWIWDEIML